MGQPTDAMWNQDTEIEPVTSLRCPVTSPRRFVMISSAGA